MPVVPMHAITKPEAGTGGSYLQDLASVIATATRLSPPRVPMCLAEWSARSTRTITRFPRPAGKKPNLLLPVQREVAKSLIGKVSAY